MADVGLLPPNTITELIEGEIIDMPPIGHRHAAIVDRLAKRLIQAAGELAHVRIQNPVRLSTVSEPQPDLALLRPRHDGYMSGHPSIEDILLIIEVSDATLDYDRSVKVPLYARHGVPEFWLVDLRHSQVHVFRSPHGDGYAERFVLASTETASISNTHIELEMEGLF